MKTESQANLALVARAESGFRGSLGPRRSAHPRPSLLTRLIARWFA